MSIFWGVYNEVGAPSGVNVMVVKALGGHIVSHTDKMSAVVFCLAPQES